nr:hypothetical protein [Tanacetum cinerariifolium]
MSHAVPELLLQLHPPWFRDPQHPDHVCLLQKSLYGLKQAPRAWFQRFASYATRVGFTRSHCDSSLFILRQGSDSAYLLIYVDDIIMTTSSTTLLQRIISFLHREFSMTDLGSLNYILGISVSHDDTLQKVCLYMHDPRELHLAALKRILHYVRGTLNYGLQLYSSLPSSLVGYTDADWAGCPTTRHFLSRSNAEAEYRGVANVVAEIAWLRNQLRELYSPLKTAIFKRAFATLFGQDVEYFTSTMFLNVDQLENQLDKEEFQEIESMVAFKYLLEYTQLEIREFHDTLIQHMEYVKTSIDKRALHKREYESMDTSSSLGNDVDADDADFKPVYDEEPMVEVPSNKTMNRNKPVEQTSVAKKPERQIPKGHRWVLTGKIFTSSTTKVDSELTNGSNEDITKQYECEQTLDVSACTINLSAVTNVFTKGLPFALFDDFRSSLSGCDASLLLDGTNSEKIAPPNLSIEGFDFIDVARDAVEKVYPRVVSCVDIIVLATRDVISFAKEVQAQKQKERVKQKKDKIDSVNVRYLFLPSLGPLNYATLDRSSMGSSRQETPNLYGHLISKTVVDIVRDTVVTPRRGFDTVVTVGISSPEKSDIPEEFVCANVEQEVDTLSHAINLYLRFEELHQFLEFQLPRQ